MVQPDRTGAGPELEPEGPGAASYLTGALGALLGAAVGALPLLLLGVFTGLFSGWLGFIVGFAAVKGYKLFRGARSHGYAVAAVITASVLVVVAACAACVLASFLAEENLQAAALSRGVPALKLAWELMLSNLPLVAVSFALPLVVSGVGIFTSRRSLSEYTEPEKLRRAAEAAREVLGGEGGKRAYFPDMRMSKGFRITNLLFILPVILLLFGTIVCTPLLPSTIESALALLAATSLALAGMCVFAAWMLPIQASMEYCLARDSDGRLWRAKLIKLSRVQGYEFGAFTGVTVPNINKLTPEQRALAEASVLRAVRDVQTGNYLPGSALPNVIIPLEDFELRGENRWVWKCVYTAPNGRRKKGSIVKAYPGFHPLDDRKAAPAAKVQLTGLAAGIVLVAAAVGLYILLAAPSWAGDSGRSGSAAQPTSTPAPAVVTYTPYTLDGVTFEVDDTWMLEQEGDGEVTFCSADNRHIYRVVMTGLGDSTLEEAFDELLAMYKENNTLLDGGQLDPMHDRNSDGVEYYFDMLDMSANVENGAYICVAPVYVPDKNLFITIQGYYSTKDHVSETRGDVLRIISSLEFQIGDKDYVSGNTYIASGDGSQLCLKDDGSFYYYASAEDHGRQYYVGSYSVYYGQEAFDQVASMEEYGLTAAEMERNLASNMRGYAPGPSNPGDMLSALDPEQFPDDRTRYHICRDTFYAVILHNDKVVLEPGDERTLGHDTLYIGYYIPELGLVDMINANTAAYHGWTYSGRTSELDVEPQT